MHKTCKRYSFEKYFFQNVRAHNCSVCVHVVESAHRVGEQTKMGEKREKGTK